MRSDADWRVRYEVAGRIDATFLGEMAGDEDAMVDELVKTRLREIADGQQQRGLYGKDQS